MKKILSTFLISILFTNINVVAQSGRNFFYRLDMGAGNLYTFVVEDIIGSSINFGTQNVVVDNSLLYSFVTNSDSNGAYRFKMNDFAGMKPWELFNDINIGPKLGYQSDNIGVFNWALYASAHYRINQFKSAYGRNTSFERERLQYFMPGIGMMLTLGSITSKLKFRVESAIRYAKPISYHGQFDNKASILNEGLSGHFDLSLVGVNWISTGLFADINFFNIYKNEPVGYKTKLYTVGLKITFTPARIEDVW